MLHGWSRDFGLARRVSPKKPRVQEFKIARPCSIPKQKVVGPQKIKISRPETKISRWRTKRAITSFCGAVGLRQTC